MQKKILSNVKNYRQKYQHQSSINSDVARGTGQLQPSSVRVVPINTHVGSRVADPLFRQINSFTRRSLRLAPTRTGCRRMAPTGRSLSDVVYLFLTPARFTDDRNRNTSKCLALYAPVSAHINDSSSHNQQPSHLPRQKSVRV